VPKIFVNRQFYFNLSSKTWSHVFWNTVYIEIKEYKEPKTRNLAVADRSCVNYAQQVTIVNFQERGILHGKKICDTFD